MTPEELENFINRADASGLAQAVEDMPEKERKKLSKTAVEIFKEWKGAVSRGEYFAGSMARYPDEKNPDESGRNPPSKVEIFFTARLALLAFCPFPKAKWSFVDMSGYLEKAALKIMMDRRPEWAGQWVDELLKKGRYCHPVINLEAVRTLITEEVIARPDSDDYIRLMVEYLPDRLWKIERGEYTPLSDKLKGAPDLLEHEIWRLFEVELQSCNDVFDFDHKPGPYDPDGVFESWGVALVKLSDNGLIDRARLLSSCLDAFSKELSSYSISGHVKFHNYLKPTAAEMKSHEATYRELLNHQITSVAGMAMKALRALQREGLLDEGAFFDACWPILRMNSKSHVTDCLQVLEQIVSADPDRSPAAARMVVEELIHPSPDVQELTINLLEKWSDGSDQELMQLISQRLDDVADSQRPRVEKLLGLADAPAGTSRLDLEEWRTDLLHRAEKIKSPWREFAGVEAARQALDQERFTWSAFGFADVPVLSGLEPVREITGVDELIECFAHGAERLDDVDEVERILSAISRLCAQRPEDFNRRTTALVHRVLAAPSIVSEQSMLYVFCGPENLRKLGLAWLRPGKDFSLPFEDNKKSSAPVLFIDGRLRELGERVAKGRAAPLLAAPTHRGGWIDPLIFVDQVLHLQRAGQEVMRFDLIQALLRLTPDHRRSALDKAASIKGLAGQVVRFALGGPDRPELKNPEELAWWLAAGRSRDPMMDLEFLFPGGADPFPDEQKPATYAWTAMSRSEYSEDGSYMEIEKLLRFKVTPKPKARFVPPDRPLTALHHHRHWDLTFYGVHCNWHLRWIGMIWRQQSDSFYAAGVRELARRMPFTSSFFDPLAPFLEPLFEPDRPLSEMACLLLWMGSMSRDGDVKRNTVEIFTESIRDGRADLDLLASVLVKLCRGGWMSLSRVSDVLAEVSRASELHAYFGFELICRWLAAQEVLPKDAHHLLALLNELMNRIGKGLDGRAKELLLKLKGSSKTAKLAKALIEYESCRTSDAVETAMLLQLESRVIRAERWSTSLRHAPVG